MLPSAGSDEFRARRCLSSTHEVRGVSRLPSDLRTCKTNYSLDTDVYTTLASTGCAQIGGTQSGVEPQSHPNAIVQELCYHTTEAAHRWLRSGPAADAILLLPLGRVSKQHSDLAQTDVVTLEAREAEPNLAGFYWVASFERCSHLWMGDKFITAALPPWRVDTQADTIVFVVTPTPQAWLTAQQLRHNSLAAATL